MKLACHDYQVDVSADGFILVNARFYVQGVRTTDTEAVSDALGKVAMALGGSAIEMVQAPTDKERCFYCGSLNEPGKLKCTSCGANL
jgi:uncharacterized protein (UPF0212 family)